MFRTAYHAFLIALALFAIFFLARISHAQGYYLSCSHGSCLAGPIPSQEAKIIIVSPTAEDEAEYLKWEKACIVGTRTDELGVVHNVYRDPICEHGGLPRQH